MLPKFLRPVRGAAAARGASGATSTIAAEGSLSAHLTVNVERQFVVWGALLTATACRLLLDARKCGSALQPFGMEGATRLSRAVDRGSSKVINLCFTVMRPCYELTTLLRRALTEPLGRSGRARRDVPGFLAQGTLRNDYKRTFYSTTYCLLEIRSWKSRHC